MGTPKTPEQKVRYVAYQKKWREDNKERIERYRIDNPAIIKKQIIKKLMDIDVLSEHLRTIFTGGYDQEGCGLNYDYQEGEVI